MTDNHALSEFCKAVSHTDKFFFLYIKNKNSFKYFGSKRVSFLLESLIDLDKEFMKLNLKLQIFEGKSTSVFEKILLQFPQISLYLNSQVEPYCLQRDKAVKELVEKKGGSCNSFTDTTIFEPGAITNSSGKHYRVFTPFKNHALEILNSKYYKTIDVNLSKLNKDNEVNIKKTGSAGLTTKYKNLERSEFFRGGRKAGLSSLKNFYKSGVLEYRNKRNFPSLPGTSRLSPHLHFGTISIREALRIAYKKLKEVKSESEKIEVRTWIGELLWREFYYNITFNFPEVMYRSFNVQFDKVKWNNDERLFKKWCEGNTGFPIVDAGMRQLNRDGWMHNRVRMIVAMFLTKDLLVDWRLGEKYFAEKLIDLDFSNNNGGWQWSASTGADAQPYFRIFNPVLQSRKFDPGGVYIKDYVPELRSVPTELIHEPHLMTYMEQEMYKVKIGKDYPLPVVDHGKVRGLAIKRYSEAAGKIKI